MAPLPRRIPVPARRRLLMVAAAAGPVVAWVAAAGLMAVLAGRESRAVTIRGMGEEQRSLILPTVAGRLTSLPVRLLDRVEAGAVVAVMDDAWVRAELRVIQAEGTLLQARVAAERDRLAVEQALADRADLVEQRRLVIDVNSARLDVLDREVVIETTRIELQRLRAEEARLSSVAQTGVFAATELEEVIYLAAEAEEFLRRSTRVLAEARAQFDDTRRRLEEFAADNTGLRMDGDVQVNAIAAEAEVITARMDSLRTTLDALVLRSPINGSVVVQYAQPGATVTPGLPVVEIVADGTSTVLAWLPEEALLRPRPGQKATIIPATGTGDTLTGHVVAVADSVVPLPLRMLRTPQQPEYGIPIRVELGSGRLPSGAAVQVRLTRD